MKKSILTVVAVMAVAGMAVADISIQWQNLVPNAVKDAAGTANLPDGALVQLIWTQGAQDALVSKAGVAGGLATGEVLLQFTVISGPGLPPNMAMWLSESVSAPVYGNGWDDGLGNAIGDVHTGYFFTRVFETAGAEAGTFYYDSANILADRVFDAQNTATIYSDNVITSTTSVAANGTTVIPEPATLGMMAVAGLGMFLARKKARR